MVSDEYGQLPPLAKQSNMYAVYVMSKIEILFNHHVTEQVERAILQSCYIVKNMDKYRENYEIYKCFIP